MNARLDRMWLATLSECNEVQRRRLAGIKALEIGRGGTTRVCTLTGMSHHTVLKGIREVQDKKRKSTTRLRKEGGGRKKIIEKRPDIIAKIKKILDETTAGDPMSLLKWSCKSTNAIAKICKEISPDTIGRIIKSEGYTLQANKKSREGKQHPDRNAQFEYINTIAKRFIKQGAPVISVDTKKKELVGDFKNKGRSWHQKGKATIVRVHDFEIPELGKVNPYGIYDLKRNEGWVNLGIDHDTAEFAVESIRQWWIHLGRKIYKTQTRLLVTADCGGSNSARARLWKRELQTLANETGLTITIAHYPPGTSKWNKIEHRLFSFISMNWKEKPLYNHATIINLIAATTTKKGLKVYARLDKKKYLKGIKVSDEEMARINIKPNYFHGEWNYTIKPN